MLFCACQGNQNTGTPEFRLLETETSIPLTPETDAPACSISWAINEMKDTGAVADNINRTIATTVFEGKHPSLESAADSFCQAYAERYKKELTDLYLADRKHHATSDWYDYKYRITTEYEKGKDDCLCYLIVKTRYEGGAREYQEVQSLNFDLKTGRLMQLRDVLQPTYPALLPPLLLQELLKAFDCRNLDELHEKGVLRLTDIYVPANFELGQEGITFIYNADEIAPLETGTVRLTVDYDKMKSFMQQK